MTRCNETCMTEGECTCAPALDAELRRVSTARHVHRELVEDSAGRVSLRIARHADISTVILEGEADTLRPPVPAWLEGYKPAPWPAGVGDEPLMGEPV